MFLITFDNNVGIDNINFEKSLKYSHYLKSLLPIAHILLALFDLQNTKESQECYCNPISAERHSHGYCSPHDPDFLI